MELNEEAKRVHTAHRDYYLWLARQAEAAWLGAEHEQWLARLRAEDDNLQAALEWSRSQPDGAEALGRLITALREYWENMGRFDEGRRWTEQALDERDRMPEGVRLQMLIGAGQFATYLGDYEQGTALFDDALNLARRQGDAYGEANALSHQGYCAVTKGDVAAAIALHTEGLARWQALGDAGHIANSLTGLGIATLLLGDIPGAIPFLEQSLKLCRASGQRYYLADALLSLGFVRFLAGEPDHALKLLAEGITICATLSTQALAARGLEEYAFIAGMHGAAEHAATLLGAAEALRKRIGVPMPPSYRHFYDQLLGTLRSALSLDVLDTAWAAGGVLTLEQAVAYALEAVGR